MAGSGDLPRRLWRKGRGRPGGWRGVAGRGPKAGWPAAGAAGAELSLLRLGLAGGVVRGRRGGVRVLADREHSHHFPAIRALDPLVPGFFGEPTVLAALPTGEQD